MKCRCPGFAVGRGVISVCLKCVPLQRALMASLPLLIIDWANMLCCGAAILTRVQVRQGGAGRACLCLCSGVRVRWTNLARHSYNRERANERNKRKESHSSYRSPRLVGHRQGKVVFGFTGVGCSDWQLVALQTLVLCLFYRGLRATQGGWVWAGVFECMCWVRDVFGSVCVCVCECTRTQLVTKSD